MSNILEPVGHLLHIHATLMCGKLISIHSCSLSRIMEGVGSSSVLA